MPARRLERERVADAGSVDALLPFLIWTFALSWGCWGVSKSVGAQTNVLYLPSPTWSVTGQIKYECLLGDVADSPLVVDDDQYSLSAGVAHRL